MEPPIPSIRAGQKKSIFVDKANRTPGGFTGGAYGETTTRIMLYAEKVTLRQ
jgi:hypothetical protein